MSSTRHSDQSAIWAEIEEKSARLGASSSTRAAAAMFDKMRDRLGAVPTAARPPRAAAAMFDKMRDRRDAFTTELRPLDGQVGAVFAIRGAIVGLDAFDSPS